MGFITFNGNYLKCEYNRSESRSINRINPSPPKRLLGVRVPHGTPLLALLKLSKSTGLPDSNQNISPTKKAPVGAFFVLSTMTYIGGIWAPR